MYFPENSVTRLFSLPSPQHSNATWSFDAWCVDVLSVVAVRRKNYCPAWKAIYKSRFFQKVIKLKQIKILVFRQTRAQTHTHTHTHTHTYKMWGGRTFLILWITTRRQQQYIRTYISIRELFLYQAAEKQKQQRLHKNIYTTSHNSYLISWSVSNGKNKTQ